MNGRNISASRAFTDGLGYAFGSFGQVMRVLLPYFAVIFAFIVVSVLAILLFRANPVLGFVFGLVLGPVVGLVVYVVFPFLFVAASVALTRNYYLGEQPAKFTPTFDIVLGRWIIILALMLAILFAFISLYLLSIVFLVGDSGTATGVAAAVFGLITVLLVFYFSARLSTWMSSAAAGKALTLTDAWRSTSGAGLRLTLAIIGHLIIFWLIGLAIILGAGFAVRANVMELLNEAPSIDFTATNIALIIGYLLFILLSFLQIACWAAFSGSVLRQTES